MITSTTVPAKLCKCDQCGREWTIYEDNPLPTHCRNRECRTREWNGKKIQVQSHVHEITFPPVRSRGERKVDYEEEP